MVCNKHHEFERSNNPLITFVDPNIDWGGGQGSCFRLCYATTWLMFFATSRRSPPRRRRTVRRCWFELQALGTASSCAGRPPVRPATHGITLPSTPHPIPSHGTMTCARCLRRNPFHTSSKNPLPEKYLARRKQVIFACCRWDGPLLPAAVMRVSGGPGQEGPTQVRAVRGAAGRLERVLTLVTGLVGAAERGAWSSNLRTHWVPVISDGRGTQIGPTHGERAEPGGKTSLPPGGHGEAAGRYNTWRCRRGRLAAPPIVERPPVTLLGARRSAGIVRWWWIGALECVLF